MEEKKKLQQNDSLSAEKQQTTHTKTVMSLSLTSARSNNVINVQFFFYFYHNQI